MLEKLTLEEVKDLVANAQSKKAIDNLVDLSKYRREEYNIDNQTNKEILLLSSRYRAIASKQRKGIIGQEEVDLEMNKVNDSLIDLVEEMESRVEQLEANQGKLEANQGKSNKAIWGLYAILGMVVLAIIIPLLANGGEESSPVAGLVETSEVVAGNTGAANSHTNLTAAEENETIEAVAKEITDNEEDHTGKVTNAGLSTPLSNSERGMVSAAGGSNILWRSTADSYAVYDKGEKLRGTESSYSGDDGIIYDPSSGKTYFLKGFKILEDSKLRPGQLLGKTNDVFWRASETTYAVYEKGEKLRGTESSYSGDDYVVYHAKTGRTYLLEDFRGVEDSEFRPGKLLSATHDIFWRASGTSYAVYDKGDKMTGTESDYSGDDLVVYSPKNEKTYLLENYRGVDDSVLRPGKLMQ